MIAQVLVGALLALGFVVAARVVARAWELHVYAVGLVAVAFVYVLFALAAGASPGRLVLELGGVVVYGALALLGLRRSVPLLGVGWGLHVAWDAGLHGLLSPGLSPSWYSGLCAGFDLTVAAYVLWALPGQLAPGSASSPPDGHTGSRDAEAESPP